MRLRALIEASAQIVWATDAEGMMSEDSPSWRTFTGQSYEEWKGRGWLECVHPDDRPGIDERWRQAVENREPLSFEYRLRHASGQWRWTRGNTVPLKDTIGNITGWVGMNTDITERKNAEMERDRANALLTAILDSSPDAIAAKDREGRYLALNHAAAKLMGHSVSELVGRTDFEVSLPNLSGSAMASDIEVMETGNVVSAEEQYFDSSGEMRFFQSVKAPLRNDTGAPMGVVIVSREVTEQKLAEEALRKSEDEFRTLADNIPQLAWMADEKGRVFWYNQRWYDYTGTTLDEMRGWDWQRVHHKEHLDRVIKHWRACLEIGKVWEDMFPLLGKEGSYRWFLSRALPIHDSAGHLVCWFGTNTDITEQLETETKLRRANTDLEQFAYSASHDLQEPLRSISIYSELLTKRYGDGLDGQAREFLGYLRTAALRMEMLVRDLLAYTQITQLEIRTEKTDANEALAAALEDLAQAIQINDAQIESSKLPAVSITRAHLQLVFQNLIGNAIKYHGTERPVISVATQKMNEYWRFSIQDNGIGIRPDYKEQIFGLFKRLHSADEYSGTGLGLAICQRIVERYHGRIWVEPGPDEGSIFYFTLPRKPSVSSFF